MAGVADVSRWELIIFDCDGVLVDSEPIANRVLRESLGRLDLHLSFEETVDHFMGRSAADCAGIMESLLEAPLPADFLEGHRRRVIAAFEAELRPVTGVEAALDAIDAPVCVASSGTHEKMERTLGLTGLASRFDGRIFSATEVARGKPAPDLFLHAARSIGADPAACAVIEDSVPGTLAGAAAGMTVFSYAALVPAGELAEAGGTVFGDMVALPELLSR